jgi:hypothetical protein
VKVQGLGDVQPHSKIETQAEKGRPTSDLFLMRLQTSEDTDVCRSILSGLSIGSHVETNTHSFSQRLLPGHSTDVDEHIVAAIVRLDESKSFVILKYLDDTGRHVVSPFADLPGFSTVLVQAPCRPARD